MLLAHHGGGRGVVAVEQLAVLAGAAAGAVAPGGFGVGAVAGAMRRGAGEGLHVRPVHCQRRAGVLELIRDGGFQQVVADPREDAGEGSVGLVFFQGSGDQAEGALGLPVGEQVRAGSPLGDHAEPCLVVCGQGGQRLMEAGQVGRPVIGEDQQHAQQQGADKELAGADPDGQQYLDPGCRPGAVDDLFQHLQRGHGRRAAPSSMTAAASGRFQRGEQVAEPLGAGDPGGVHERGQAEQPGAVGQPGHPQPGGLQPGQPGPAGQRPGQRGRDVLAHGAGPAGNQPGPGELRRGEQDVVVAGQDRHHPGPGPVADLDDHPAGAAGHVGAADAAQVRPGQAVPAPRATSPAARIRRAGVGWAPASAR